MKKLMEAVVKTGIKFFNILAQDDAHHNPEKTITEGMPELLRSAAAQAGGILESFHIQYIPTAALCKQKVLSIRGNLCRFLSAAVSHFANCYIFRIL